MTLSPLPCLSERGCFLHPGPLNKDAPERIHRSHQEVVRAKKTNISWDLGTVCSHSITLPRMTNKGSNWIRNNSGCMFMCRDIEVYQKGLTGRKCLRAALRHPAFLSQCLSPPLRQSSKLETSGSPGIYPFPSHLLHPVFYPLTISQTSLGRQYLC